LKGVLAAVRRVLDAKVAMETECADVQERVTTMKVSGHGGGGPEAGQGGMTGAWGFDVTLGLPVQPAFNASGVKLCGRICLGFFARHDAHAPFAHPPPPCRRGVQMHGLEMEADEVEAADELHRVWQGTVDAALTRDRRLVRVKDEFREVTRRDVEAFSAACDDMRRLYFANGPSSMGITLAAGVAMLAEYRAKLAEAHRKRESFVTAERLFGLPLTRYGQLQDITDDIDRVAPLYELYSEQVAFAETNSNMLWADLDIAALQKGADDLFKRLQRLKELRGTSVYLAVSDEVTSFKEAVPLIATLKNPAMKERHWDKIAALTGIRIAFNPKTFTLGSIFAMNLSRFTEPINEIVNEARQELKIERDLRAIADKWAATSFGVAKYMKNGEQRG
jgi:dynein heavy chain, axonemal